MLVQSVGAKSNWLKLVHRQDKIGNYPNICISRLILVMCNQTDIAVGRTKETERGSVSEPK